MANQQEVFTNSLALFSADAEAVRSAAAFAAGTWDKRLQFTRCVIMSCPGNIAVGSVQTFLPPLVTQMQDSPDKRLLTLQALKEVSLTALYHDRGINFSSRLLPIALGINWRSSPGRFGHRCSLSHPHRKRWLGTLRLVAWVS
jgi:hypothetical protein